MKVGIVGASGYSGEVLVKLLLGHPQVTLAAVTSRTLAGKPLAAMPAMRGIDRGLKFVDSDVAALAASDIALFFLALPHGAAATYAKALVAAGKRVIDLSADFRISDLATYQKYYGPGTKRSSIWIRPSTAQFAFGSTTVAAGSKLRLSAATRVPSRASHSRLSMAAFTGCSFGLSSAN